MKTSFQPQESGVPQRRIVINKKVKRVIISVSCLIVAVSLFFGGRLLVDTMRYRRIISEIEIKTPNLTHIHDGTFNGSFDAILVSADVDVTVENHVITGVTINRHDHDRGDGAEVVAIDVVDSQSLEIDTVSGATNSCLVILKAIQNALESGEY